MPLRHGLACLVCFVGMFPQWSLSLINCSINDCPSTLFAGLLKFVLPLSPSAISGVANSIKSPDIRFAAGRTYFREEGIADLPIT